LAQVKACDLKHPNTSTLEDIKALLDEIGLKIELLNNSVNAYYSGLTTSLD